MNEDQLTPEELNLIQQLRAEQKPQIRPQVAAVIREQLLAEFRALPQQSQPAPVRLPIRFLLAIAASVVLVLGALLSQRPNMGNSISTAPATSVALAVSETPAYSPTTALTTTVGAPTPTMSVSSMLTSVPSSLIVIEGPVSAITRAALTVYDMNIPVAADHPIRNLVEVGDLVHVEGSYDASGTFVTAVIGNLSKTALAAEASVGLEGTVQAIDENILVVNNIKVQLDFDAPLLQTVRVGDFVSVEGNFQSSEGTIVLHVLKIIVRTDVREIESDCWYHEGMGMGHWHCDGMGMGMGDGAMGMGDDSMGMGR